MKFAKNKYFWMASLFSLTTLPLSIFGNEDQNSEVNTVVEVEEAPFPSNQNCEVNPVVEVEETPCPCIDISLDSHFEIGANYTYVTLKLHEHGTFHGSLGGMQALYEYRPMNYFYGGAKVTWREGKTKGSAGTRSLLYFDVHERLGYTFAPVDRDWSLSLFSGFGYRYLGHKFHPKSSSSLRFKYNEFYIPVGVLTNYDVSSWFSIGLDCIWMPQVFSSVSIVPLKGARWVIKKKLSNFYAEMPFTFALNEDKRFLITFNPFYEHWEDGHSTAKLSSGTSLGLPGNTYNFYGAELNFGYCF